MSDFHRILNRPSTRPVVRGPLPILEDEPTSDSSSSASSMSSTMTIIPPSDALHNSISTSAWKDYFEQELYLESSKPKAEYHVYLTPPRDATKDPLFVCHHGAGSSGLSFACLAQALRRKVPGAGVLSLDARDHGSVVEKESEGQSTDFSLEALAGDLHAMVKLTQARMQWAELPKLVLLGHSLGGAVVTRLAREGSFGARLVGFCVIDVVEGSAIEALMSMKQYLSTRPVEFPSLDAAVMWHVRSRTVRNHESARVSTSGLVVEARPGVWTWRTDLATTQPFWEEWFTGLSAGFLSGKAAKLLLLAGTDRLDKDLTIGQMQGKFQMQIFPEAGHFVHEDLPEQTADTVVDFYKRNDRSQLVLPPKVSDMLKQGIRV